MGRADIFGIKEDASNDKFVMKFERSRSEGKKVTYSRNEVEHGRKVVRTENGNIDTKATYYNVSLKLPRELEQPLKDKVWAEHTNITNYVIKLIEADLGINND